MKSIPEIIAAIKSRENGRTVGMDEEKPFDLRLALEIERLRAIVDRVNLGCGKTIDGKHYAPGDKVFYVDPCGEIQGLDVGMKYRTDSSVPEQVDWPHPVFSTREAAEASRRAE